ncbi:MAG: Asp-tRNA(Asn)/Glu-tRNA(Gln) amidotransferase subunit GatA [Deltaproteobacteria bacterium]|nr:Asp-tRNA(Asn)/Glu-tRNA(Gln) amidotransferase subunit GatA [Deltaproteobacteria bacterium]
MKLHEFTIAQLHEKIKSKEVSSHEATLAQWVQIESVEPRIQSYITLCKEASLKQAEKIDEEISKGREIKPLTGIPFALKDIFLTEGLKTTCASKILENYVATYTGTAAQKLLEDGIILLGKLNMDEFAMGSSTETSSFKKTKNPWNLECTPGGSSGGSSAAVSADLCFGSLGTDTGGSIRQPAALTSIVGLKPTYGRVSRYGVIAFASSLDQVGPMAKDVRDTALILNSIAGYDAKDSTSMKIEVPDYTKSLTGEVKGMRIGVPKEYFVKGMDPEIEQAVRESIKVYEKLGAICEEVSLPHTEYAVPTYYIIAPAEASSNLARYDGVRYGHRTANAKDLNEMYSLTRSEGFGPEVKRRIMLGTYVLSAGYYDAYYLKAQKVRTLIRQDFENCFKKYDVILSPVTPSPAFKLGEKTEDPIQMYLSDIFTINVNLAGLPGMSLPCGFTKSGLPIGLQLIGNAFEEEKIFRAAYAYEQNTEWHLKKPVL